MANQPFTTWEFAATDAPTGRTMPDRLSDIINVRDWGAVGNGTTNDTAAIQAAIDYAMEEKDGGVRGGIVFFPNGHYPIASPLIVGGDNDASVTLKGCGKYASYLLRSSSPAYSDAGGIGYMISSGTETYDCLARMESMGGGTGFNIKATRDGFSIEDCQFASASTLSAPIGLNVVEADGALVRSCTSNGPPNTHSISDDPSPGEIRGFAPDTIGICLGTGGTAIACNLIGGWEIGYALSGDGSSLLGCRSEVVGNGVRVGWGPDGETASYGATVQGQQCEQVTWQYVLYNATGCTMIGNYGGQGNGSTVTEAMTLSWSGGTATITNTGGVHNVSAGTYVLEIAGVAAAWFPSGDLSCNLMEVTRASTTTFTYPLAGDPGGADASGTWRWPMEYTLRVRKAYECAIIGNHLNPVTVYGVDLDYDGEAEHRNCFISGLRTRFGWIMPTDTTNLAAWTFIGVGNTTAIEFFSSPNELNPYGHMIYADLPGEAGVLQDGPYEGQEFDITDGNSSAFDATQAGGGSGNYRVRYNGSVWKRVG